MDKECTGCPWSWDLGPVESEELLRFLGDMTQSTWGEIMSQETGSGRRRKKHHVMPVDTLEKCARDRLEAMSDTWDTMYRFRLGGKIRLWGFRDRAIFHLVWIDWEHAVYPTDP